MSNNAVAAYGEGLLPASKIKRVPAGLIQRYCRFSEWHHSSKAYNRVKFYDPEYVLACFGLIRHEDHPSIPDAVAALAEARKRRTKLLPEVYGPCSVRWLEWSGTLRRPHCEEHTADNAVVSLKGQTATITLATGRVFIKRLSTRGFSFTPGIQS